MATVVLLPSPLLPATAYTGLADALRAAGEEPVVGDPVPAVDRPVDDVVEHWVQEAAGCDLLVAHSNAGLLAPVVRSRSGVDARILFMDAALLPESGRTRLAPQSLRDLLAALADERGLVPPWTRWWSREALRAVIPADLFDELDRTCPRLPLAYFDQRVEAPPGWATAPNAYLAFGETYADELDVARDHSWPTDRLDGGHLHFLHDPALVADRILALAQRLG